jgi:hypothetical protein
VYPARSRVSAHVSQTQDDATGETHAIAKDSDRTRRS